MAYSLVNHFKQLNDYQDSNHRFHALTYDGGEETHTATDAWNINLLVIGALKAAGSLSDFHKCKPSQMIQKRPQAYEIFQHNQFNFNPFTWLF